MKRMKYAIIALILLLFVLSPTQAISKFSSPSKLDKNLLESFNKNGDNTYSVIVILKNKPKVAIRNKITALKSLKSKMKNSQKNIVSYLKVRKQQGSIKKYYPYWILNGINVVANADEIKKIASRDDVRIIVHDAKLEKPKLPKTKQVIAPLNGVEWNIAKIGADSVWVNGYDGTGIKVGIMDSGIDGKHPDFAGKILKFSKYDSKGNIVEVASDKATDYYGHGTHVSGIVAGGNAGGTSIGVAPGAKLIVHEMAFSLSFVYKSMEWMIDEGADILNMSWGYSCYGDYSDISAMPQFFDPIDNMIAAGVIPIAAIGNSGEKSSTSPADSPSALAVGATDANDKVTYWSSGAVVPFNDPPYEGNWVKPDVSAPGDSIRSAISGYIKFVNDIFGEGGGQWAELSGTSMSAPHTAGVAALIKQANPTLTAKQIIQILQSSSIDKGTLGKDIRYGFGRIDAQRAVEFALKPGGLKGKITTSTGKEIVATIKVKDTDTVLTSNEKGDYEAILPTGSYELEFNAHGFLPKTENVTVEDNIETIKNITLATSPKYVVSGTVTDQSDGKKLIANLIIKSPENIDVDSNTEGQYAFSVPHGTYLLQVKSFGYETQNVTLNVTEDIPNQNFEMVKVPPLLFVDEESWFNDEGEMYPGSHVNYYTSSLDALVGNEYTYWPSYAGEDSNSPTYDDLRQYKTVIWYTNNIPSALYVEEENKKNIDDEEDIEAIIEKMLQATKDKRSGLEKYMDAGGKLLIANPDFGYYSSDEEETYLYGNGDDESEEELSYVSRADIFFKKYLQAKYVSDTSKNFSVEGTDGTFMNDTDFALYGSGGANNQLSPDVIKPDGKYAKSLFRYTKDDRGVAAIGNDNGKHKIVYLAFGFEGINSAAKRDEVMEKSLTWLDTDTFPPNLSLKFSNKSVYLRQNSTIYANATDNDKVAKVEFYLNGTKKKTDTAKPYYYTFDTRKYKNGSHGLKVKVFDQSGNSRSTTKKIYIDNKKPNVKLLINLSNPSDISSITGNAKLSAKTNDNLGIGKVEFYVDSKLVGRDGFSPFGIFINSSKFLNGTRVVKAISYDKAGNVAKSYSNVVFQNPISLSIYTSPSVFSPDGDGKNDNTTIVYGLSQNATVTVYIRSAWGRIATLVDDADKSKGTYSIKWDGKNNRGNVVKNGRYRAEISTTFEGKTYTSSRVVEVKK